MKCLILIGPSGVGKSTYAKKWLEEDVVSCQDNVVICSADNFPSLYRENGSIDFSKLGEAHQACFLSFLRTMSRELHSDKDFTIVDNTNCSMDQLAPYVRVATAYNVEPEIVALQPRDPVPDNVRDRKPWHQDRTIADRLAKRNVHGTPAKAILGMMSSMKLMLNYWQNYFPPVKVVNVQDGE